MASLTSTATATGQTEDDASKESSISIREMLHSESNTTAYSLILNFINENMPK